MIETARFFLVGVRFLRRGDGQFPCALCVRRLGSRHTTDRSLECDQTSDCGMDRASRLHRFLIHDRHSIYADHVDQTIAAMGLTILKTPARSAQANVFCERVIGTIRRECLDWMILINEDHLRRVLRGVGRALQSRTSAQQPRPRHSRGTCPRARAVWASYSQRPPRRRHADSWRPSSRVPP